MTDYTSYPEGYNKLKKKLVPFLFRPVGDMLMSMLLTILRDG